MAIDDRISYLIGESLKDLSSSSDLSEQVDQLRQHVLDLSERIDRMERQRVPRTRKPGDE